MYFGALRGLNDPLSVYNEALLVLNRTLKRWTIKILPASLLAGCPAEQHASRSSAQPARGSLRAHYGAPWMHYGTLRNATEHNETLRSATERYRTLRNTTEHYGRTTDALRSTTDALRSTTEHWVLLPGEKYPPESGY